MRNADTACISDITVFSGGELKRIDIATVLARDVRLALLDEYEAEEQIINGFLK